MEKPGIGTRQGDLVFDRRHEPDYSKAMVFHFQINRSPRTILFVVLLVLLVVLGIYFLFGISFPFNLLGAGLTFFLAWGIFNIIRNQVKSRITTHDDGVSAVTTMGEKISVPWPLITHAGLYSESRKAQILYIYAESTDQVLSIPQDYQPFDQLLDEVKERLSFELETVELGEGQTLIDYLKEKLGLNKNSGDLKSDAGSEEEPSTEAGASKDSD